MGIRWQIKFQSFLGTDYTLSIYDTAWSGGVTQLTGGEVPFETTEDDDEDLYMPIRTQSGTIRFIAENDSILGQVLPQQPTDRPVVLTDGSGTVCWVGFVSGEQYSQPWAPCPYEVEVPVLSVMLAMQGVEFTQQEGYVSLLELMNTISAYMPVSTEYTVDSSIQILNVYVQNNCFRDFLTVAEREERSTSNMYECQTLYDCVEQFCLYFGVSLREYGGKFYFTTHNASNYVDVDSHGSTQYTQYGSTTIDAMDVISESNMVDYTKAYRRVVGNFSTQREKMEKVFEVDSFLKHFGVNRTYYTGADVMLFNGNGSVQPYIDGSPEVGELKESSSATGGQIIRTRTSRINTPDMLKPAFMDYFFVMSSKTGNMQTAMAFYIERPVYINAGEYAALNISGKVYPWFEMTQDEDFIKRLHCKVRIGNYWLSSEIPGSSQLTRYSWETVESDCWLMVSNGSITTDGAQYTVNAYVASTMDSTDGLVINLPDLLGSGYHDMYFELLANAEDEEDFGEYSKIGYLVSGLCIQIIRGTSDASKPTPDFDTNTVIRDTHTMHRGDYAVDCQMTTKRGVQYGAGVTLSYLNYYETAHHEDDGVERRAAALSTPHELLTVYVRGRVQPIEPVSGRLPLSQSVDWRNDETKLRIIKV